MENCCYPRCELAPTSRVDEPLCDMHLISVYRSVTALGRQKMIELDHPEPHKGAPSWHKYATLGEVYFIRFGDRIKIGFSTDVEKRKRAIPCDEVLATMPGSRHTESQMHSKFAHLRLVGEWFSMGEDLMEYIASLRTAA